MIGIMPSWNVHTAHAESILTDALSDSFGIADANSFLFGNYVPDIYVGFMVRDASFRIDYCMTHVARVNPIPVPDADFFWDQYVARRRLSSPEGESLVLGAWAHLVADRVYNGAFREVKPLHSSLDDDALRRYKQADFDLFGRSLQACRHVQVTDDLLKAARAFPQYRVEAEDVERAVRVASEITRKSEAFQAGGGEYRLLDEAWLGNVFDTCHEHIATWLQARHQLEVEGARCFAADIRNRIGCSPEDEETAFAPK